MHSRLLAHQLDLYLVTTVVGKIIYRHLPCK